MPHAMPPCPKLFLKIEGNAMLLGVLGPRLATCAVVKRVFDGVVVEDVLRLCNEHKEAQKPLQAHVANKQSYQLLLALEAHPPRWRHLQSV